MAEDNYHKAMNEKARIKDEISKITRTGRQPPLRGSTKEQKQKREDRVSGRSFDSYGTSDSSNNNPNNMMVIPEDDLDQQKEPHFGGIVSPQTDMSLRTTAELKDSGLSADTNNLT